MNPVPRRPKKLASFLILAASLLALLIAAGPASAAGVVNGDFESGTLEGWQQTSSGEENSGEWLVTSGTVAPFSDLTAEIESVEREITALEEEIETLEEESEPTAEAEAELVEEEEELAEREQERAAGQGTVPAPFHGSFDAIADEHGPSAMILYQDVALEAGVPQGLSLYFNFHSFADMAIPSPNSLNVETMAANQQVRVDVMKAGSSVSSLEPGDILTTLYATTGPDSPVQIPWTRLTANLSAYAGQTVRIRIAAVDNSYYLNAGVDDVSLSPIPLPIPAPPSNAFTFGKLAKNARKGSATLTLNVPGPGVVTLASAGAKSAAASASKAKKAKGPKKPKTAVKKATLTATAAGTVKLPITPTAGALKYLKAKHSLSAKVAITFTPTGGTAKTVTKTVVLKLAKPKPKPKKK
jgi:hypothetical protein